MKHWKWPNLTAFLIFLGIGAGLYTSALDSVFTYDDDHLIVQNYSIRSLNQIPSYFIDTSTSSILPGGSSIYRPILMATYAINYALGGYRPSGYHLVNLMFHIGTVFLVFLLVRQLMSGIGLPGTGVSSPWVPAGIAGLVMMAHPFNSEVVNYATARSSVMSIFFYTVAFYAYVLSRRAVSPRGGVLTDPSWPGRFEVLSPISVGTANTRRIRRLVGISLTMFLIGVLTKETLITLPIMIVLYELVFVPRQDRPWSGVAWRLLPYGVILALYLAVRKFLTGALGPREIARDFDTNLWLQAEALVSQWGKLFLPTHLSIEYQNPQMHPGVSLETIGSVLFLLAVMMLMVLLWRSKSLTNKVIGFFLAWFYIIQLPTIVIPLHAVLQDNRGYGASITFAVMAGLFFHGLLRSRWGLVRVMGMALLCVVVLSYSWGVLDRNEVWGNEVILWQDAVRKSPEAYGPRFGLGTAYRRENDLMSAEQEFRYALRLNGRDSVLLNDLGTLATLMGREAEAAAFYQRALSVNPRYDLAMSNLGLLYQKQGNLSKAISVLEQAIQHNARNQTAVIQLGAIYQQAGQTDRALDLYRNVRQGHNRLPQVQMQEGYIYQRRGDHQNAIRRFQAVTALEPTSPDAYLALGQEYLLVNRPPLAIKALEKALRLEPQEGFGYLTLGKIYEQLGNRSKARSLYQDALRLNPGLGDNQRVIAIAKKELEHLQ